ncbi:MAG TPA: hypothetical protein GX396_08110, partial [Tissierellia bacterium]|nr:hypothetical protein [Tissierellia bacterium]
MKRKISLILVMMLLLSTLTSVVAAEGNEDGVEITESGPLMLSMDEAVKIA